MKSYHGVSEKVSGREWPLGSGAGTSTTCSAACSDHAAFSVPLILCIGNCCLAFAPNRSNVLLRTGCANTLHASPDDPIALDGKTVRGAKTQEHAAPHLLSFRTHQSQETLLQVAVCEKTNEIPVAQALLPALP